MEPTLLLAAVVLAALVIKTAVEELGEPGRGRARWAFLRDRRALAAGAVVTLVLGFLGWLLGGGEGLVWGCLAGVLAAYATNAHGRGT
ncbi:MULTISPECIES: hypothetical protein [unclassified Streptomyces]|uniref:hypothetical protein n=1 Tax=unclassified Streptomyces TaxID=2593676 RepID=UPI0005613A89|nr:hypothetical protein [Streptomyces sp. PCS3-D2]WKV71334.1 hypothetical protein AW27_007210 [Streptomyces sp. PCS3-D2]